MNKRATTLHIFTCNFEIVVQWPNSMGKVYCYAPPKRLTRTGLIYFPLSNHFHDTPREEEYRRKQDLTVHVSRSFFKIHSRFSQQEGSPLPQPRPAWPSEACQWCPVKLSDAVAEAVLASTVFETDRCSCSLHAALLLASRHSESHKRGQGIQPISRNFIPTTFILMAGALLQFAHQSPQHDNTFSNKCPEKFFITLLNCASSQWKSISQSNKWMLLDAPSAQAESSLVRC